MVAKRIELLTELTPCHKINGKLFELYIATIREGSLVISSSCLSLQLHFLLEVANFGNMVSSNIPFLNMDYISPWSSE